MVEALQVLLMTHGALEPIPIQYNSYVLHLVEGFAVAQENIRKAEAAYREAKQSLEHNLEQFRLVADDWLERESQYRAEVKRLEVLLVSREYRNPSAPTDRCRCSLNVPEVDSRLWHWPGQIASLIAMALKVPGSSRSSTNLERTTPMVHSKQKARLICRALPLRTNMSDMIL